MSIKKQKKIMSLKKKRGQSSVEYILIIAAVVGVIFMFGKTFKTKIQGVTENLFGGVDSGVSDLMKK